MNQYTYNIINKSTELIISSNQTKKKARKKHTPLAMTTPATTGTRAAYVIQASLLRVAK
jgi:hypothetical protein